MNNKKPIKLNNTEVSRFHFVVTVSLHISNENTVIKALKAREYSFIDWDTSFYNLYSSGLMYTSGIPTSICQA